MAGSDEPKIAGPDEHGDAFAYLRVASERSGVAITEYVVPESVQMIAGDIRLHYLDWGAAGKPPIVFLHGGGLNAHSWNVVCLALRSRFHCIAPDLRGHGDSEWPPELDYSYDAYARDLQCLLDRLPGGRVILVGMSLGGLVALHFAAVAPERVRALVVVDVGPNVRRQNGAEIREFMNATSGLSSIEDYVEQAAKFNPRRSPDLLRQSLLNNLRRRPDGSWAWKYDPRPRQSDNVIRGIEERTRKLWEEAATIEAPTLIVRGGESRVFAAEEAEALAAQLPDGRWVTVENAGHTVQGDNPAGLLRELDAFLRALD